MKHLYLVRYWVPFPASEYGGLISVIAKDDHECHDLLLNWRNECDSHYDGQIMNEVKTALKFDLSEDLDSGVVDSFTT